MIDEKKKMCVFILAKNEQQNIKRCLESLRPANWDVVVLDSGSVDNTHRIVSEFDFSELRHYNYTNHCDAYNEITTCLGLKYQHVIVLDADMTISEELQCEISSLINCRNLVEVLEADVLMFTDGLPLKYGSLYPPKPFLFASGKSYFVNSGHAEKLAPEVVVQRTNEKLRHDDRKSYASYLSSQLRYSQNLVARKAAGQISLRDWLRTKTPLLIFVVPFISYVLKWGFMSGRAGGSYAIDRLIAEAIMYRQSLSKKLGDM